MKNFKNHLIKITIMFSLVLPLSSYSSLLSKISHRCRVVFTEYVPQPKLKNRIKTIEKTLASLDEISIVKKFHDAKETMIVRSFHIRKKLESIALETQSKIQDKGRMLIVEIEKNLHPKNAEKQSLPIKKQIKRAITKLWSKVSRDSNKIDAEIRTQFSELMDKITVKLDQLQIAKQVDRVKSIEVRAIEREIKSLIEKFKEDVIEKSNTIISNLEKTKWSYNPS